MILRDLRAQEVHCAQIIERFRPDYARAKAITGILIDDQRAIFARDRAEEAGVCVRNGSQFLRGDLEAIDVRDARVVGAAIEVATVRREDEAFWRGAS